MRTIALLLAAAACTAALPANADDWRQNRLVGAWSSEGQIGPCNAVPSQRIFATIAFHKGGTVSEIPRFPPTGIAGQVRTDALGTWTYNADKNVYFAVFQFDWYLNGVYDGYQVVERKIRLRNGQAGGGVVSVRYDASGNPIGRVCGYATSTRL